MDTSFPIHYLIAPGLTLREDVVRSIAGLVAMPPQEVVATLQEMSYAHLDIADAKLIHHGDHAALARSIARWI